MEPTENLGTEAVESPSTVEANVENPTTTIADKYFSEELDAQASKQEAELAEMTGDGEALIDESAGSEGNVDEVSGEEVTEVAELEETEGEEHPNVDENKEGEVESIVAYDEMLNHNFEIDGKLYTADDIKSVFGQEKAAGTKSREASDKLKELESRAEKLNEFEAELQTRKQASVSSNDMLRIQAEGREINALLQKADQEGDAYEIVLQERKLKGLEQQYQVAKQNVEAESLRSSQAQFANAETGLKDKGLGYLLEDGPAADAWNNYTKTHLTEVESRTVAMVPAFAEMAEKARKWDNANKSQGKKLQSSGKSLKAGSNQPVSSKKTKAQQARTARIKSGNATEHDLNQTTKGIIGKYFS